MRDQKRVTIKDVARETGLALSTVSNALAGKQYVSEETRKLVSETATRLGYRASLVARSLRMQRSFTIGVLTADVSNPSSADFVRGVEDVAIREKCTLLLCNTDGDEERQIGHMRTLIDRQVDGMVLISQHCQSPKIRDILDNGPPFVCVQRRSVLHKDDYVGSDNIKGVTEAVRYLHAIGHRRIGFATGPLDSSSARERVETFREEAARLKLRSFEDLVFPSEYNFDSGLVAGHHFAGLRTRPTAILSSSDMNALGVMQAFLDRGFSVPRDISVVGFDDILLAGVRMIDLTTVQLLKRDMGEAAADLLMKRIRNPKRPHKQLIVPTKLMIRGSTAPKSPARTRIDATLEKI